MTRPKRTPPGVRPVVTAVAAAALAMAAFLLPFSEFFPMDDSYIHAAYADNLARTGRLEFNTGEFTGIGSTSILWVLIIAGLSAAGIPVIAAARLLGALSLILTTATLAWLLERWMPRIMPNAPPWLTHAAAIAGGLSGNMVWFALSGMETLLFLGLALLACALYASGRWVGLGVAAGLAALTRLEGVVLLMAILGTDIATASNDAPQRLRRGVIPTLVTAAVLAPWILYLHSRTGHWLPTSFGGKKLAHLAATATGIGRAGALGALASAPPVLFVLLWVAYALAWVYGLGFGFPPSVRVGAGLGGGGVDLWLLAVPLLVLIVLPLGAVGARALWRARSNLVSDAVGRSVLAFLVWVVLHNAAYAVLFPSLGTTSRYQAVNHVLLWLLPVLGLGALHSRLRWVPAVLLAALMTANLVHWRGTYAANIEHMAGVRVAAAEWIRSAPPSARVAAFDIGALRWFSGRPITDLGGLVDAEFVEYQKSGRPGQFLRERGVTHVAIPSAHSTEESGFFDLAGFLGLRSDPAIRLEKVFHVEGEYDDWRRGAGPTFNYMPSVVIYRVRYLEQP